MSYLVQIGILVDYCFEELHAVLAAEGREPADHFVDQASQTPPVDVDSMANLLDDFGSQVLRSPADGIGGLLVV
jgi:hypothetical protein